MHNSRYPAKLKVHSFFILIILFAAFLSCTKKDKENCYICTTTYTITTDVPMTGYPATTTMDVELCDIDQAQVTEYEQVNKGSDTQTVGGVTYSDSHSTVCNPN